MKSYLMEEYHGRVIELDKPDFHPALRRSILEAASLADFREAALIAQSEPKNGGIFSPLRRLSDTFKKKGQRKQSTSARVKERNGSISSDSGEGSMSDGSSSTHSINTNASSERSRPQHGERSEPRHQNNNKFRLPLNMRSSRRFSSPEPSPTKLTFDHVDFPTDGQPIKSCLKKTRARGLSLPDIKRWDGNNGITNPNIRITRGFNIPCLEEVDEEYQLADDSRTCFDATRTEGKHSRSSTVLISEHNENEQELIELNKRLDRKTLRDSAQIIDEEGMTILHRAIQNGFGALAKFLVTSGVSTEIKDKRGWTALYLALEKRDFECAEMLARLGANLNHANKGGETILHRMAQEGNYKAIQFLVKHGAQLNKEDEKGWPALHYALKRKDLKCAALLMTSGANIHRYTEKRVSEYSISMEIVNIGKVKMDGSLQKTQTLHRDSPTREVTMI